MKKIISFIHNMNWYYSSESLHFQKQHVSRNWLIVYGLICWAYDILLSLKNLLMCKTIFKLEGDILFVNSKNQYEALINMPEVGKRTVVVPSRLKMNHWLHGKVDSFLPVFFVELLSLPCLIILPFLFVMSNDFQRKSCSLHVHLYLRTLPFYLVFYLMMKISKTNVKRVFLSNDHLMEHRVINRICRSFGIPTIYVQHAHINKHFPPLDYDCSFLDGRVSCDIYKKTKENGKVFLIGAVRNSLPIIKPYLEEDRNKICVTYNSFDDEDALEATIRKLKKEFPRFTLVIRPHPLDARRQLIENLSDEGGIVFSDPLEMPLDIFFEQGAFHISANSSTHLDAISHGLPSFSIADFVKRQHYDFIDRGLVWKVSSVSDIKNFNLAEVFKEQREIASLYNAALDYKGDAVQAITKALKDDYSLFLQEEDDVYCLKNA